MFVIGLDIGTSGVKSTVFDDHANVVGHAYREYDLISSGEGMYELDPHVILEGSWAVLAESTRNCDGKKVRAICVTSFGESFVCLDEADNILAKTMIYMDNRGSEECAELMRAFPQREIYDVSGQYVDRMFAIYKIRWMQKHRPKVMEKVRRICFITDFITYMLGADHVCDYSLAARSAMFDIRKKKWWKEGVAFSGIDPAVLPKPVPSGSVAGTVSKETAEKLGMSGNVKLIVGGHDQIFAAIGSGASKAGDIANGMGTVDCMISVISGDVRREYMMDCSLPMIPYLDPDVYVTYASNISGGCVVKWFRDNFAKDIAHLPDVYDLLAKEAPKKPTSLLFIPYLAGGGTPYMDNMTPGTIAGLRLNHTRGDVMRAFLEGETYDMKSILECMESAGITAKKIITVGGGSKSSLWMQIRADVFERDVYLPENREAGTLASALVCYKNIGMYATIKEAQNDLIKYAKIYSPDRANRDRYRENYEKYRALYKTIKNFYQK
jgi:xylulokinase